MRVVIRIVVIRFVLFRLVVKRFVICENPRVAVGFLHVGKADGCKENC